MDKRFASTRFLSIILFVFVFTSFFSSCKKADIISQQPEINYEEKFFTVPAGTHPSVVRVINKIKEQNNQHHFVNEFVKKHGFPKWEHATVQPRKNSFGPRSSDTNGEETLVLIPVANELQEKIKDILACEVNASDVLIKLIEDYRYKYFGYEPNAEGYATAKDIAALFMQFEMKVYEKKIFEIKDVELAKKMLGDQWEDKLTTLILKEDPITNEIGFYKTASVLVVPMPNYVEIPGIIHVSGGSQPVYFSDFVGIHLGGGGFNWWLGGTGDYGGSGEGGGDSGGDSGGSSGGGSGTGTGGGSGGSGGGNDDEEPGWEEPPCGGVWEGESYKKFECPEGDNPNDSTLIMDSIPNILSRACDKQMDSLYSWGMNNNFKEQSFIIVRNSRNIYPKNFLPGFQAGDKTRVNYTLAPDEALLAYVHIHAEDTVNYYRTSFSAEDLKEFNEKATFVGYTALLEVGNARYAFVLEDVQKKSTFNIIKRGNHVRLYEALLQSLSIQFPNGQTCTEQAWIQYLGSSSVSGIGFYKSTAPNKNNFTKLNP